MNEEDVKEAYDGAYEAVQAATKLMQSIDDDFYTSTAKHWNKMFKAAMNAGFNHEQALLLVSSSIRAAK